LSVRSKKRSFAAYLRAVLELKIVNHSKHPLPKYETVQSAGMDLRAELSETIEIGPFERKLIGTGLHLELDEGYEAQIRPRSGLAWKQGLTVLNAPGTIDSDYRGEIKVILVNLSDVPQLIQDGDRIAQMVIARYEQAKLLSVKELSQTKRGTGGYGHTGVK